MLIVEFGESTINRTQVQLWHSRFKEGRENVNDDARPDRPSMSTTDENIEAVMKMILYNLGISFGSCQAIFMDVLSMLQLFQNY